MSGTTTKTWTAFDAKISDQAREVFNKALGGTAGKSYQPVAVAIQSASGVDYCFFCSTEASKKSALVDIHQSVNGTVKLTGIKLWDKRLNIS